MSDVCTDLTAGLNVHYSGAFPMKDDNRQDCTQKCGDYALQYYQNLANKQSLANCACAEGLADGSIIRAYGAVGTKEYEQGQSVGVLINTPAVTKTTCTCPSGWLSDVTNINGGVTPTGKCKKIVCQPISVTPPPNDTQVGTWGFIWGNALIAWGSSANGGAAICNTVVLSPPVCRIQ